MPEISTSNAGTLGRETLAAIAEDEAAQPKLARDPRPSPQDPSISYRQTEAGRETLAVIDRELRQAAPGALRPAMSTLDFEARPPRTTVGFDEPARQPPQPPQPPPKRRPMSYRETSAPEIEIGYVPAIRLGQPSMDNAPPSKPAPPSLKQPAAQRRMPEDALWAQLQSAEVSESYAFIVRGAPQLEHAPRELLLRFVQARLLHRLPVKSADELVAIDVSPRPAEGALQLVVWVPIKTLP